LKGADGDTGAAAGEVALANNLGAIPAAAIRPRNLAKKVFRECVGLTGRVEMVEISRRANAARI
jgi:hypothetical protein